MYTKHLTLANNAQIPQLGLGTWFIEDAAASDAVIVVEDCPRRDFEPAMETLKHFKKIENYGASSGFPVYGGKI